MTYKNTVLQYSVNSFATEYVTHRKKRQKHVATTCHVVTSITNSPKNSSMPINPLWGGKAFGEFDVHVTVHCVKFLIIKPTRCTNFSNLFFEWNSTCFGQFLCTSSGVFHCTHSNGICHTGLLTACEQNQNVTSWSCSQDVSKPVWHITFLCVHWKTPDDGQRNCSKHVEFYFKINLRN